MTKTDKRSRAALFRRRMDTALAQAEMSRSALARAVGVDRSTVSQLLADGGTRLPNAQVVAECASALGVSADWLLGLTDLPEQAADLLAASVEMPEAPRAAEDAQLLAWHQEAAGYKIRYVPARLPDILKSADMLHWEYAPYLGKTVAQATGASFDRLELIREAMSDFEIAMPLFELDCMVRGTGYYETLPKAVRRGQVDRMLALHDQLYPSMRIFLFDARRLYSAPLTVFGPLVVALYVGQRFVAFRDADRVRGFTRHFDELIREAHVEARAFPDHLRDLAAQAGL